MSETIIFQTLLFAWPNLETAAQVSKEIRYNHLLRGRTITDHAVVRHDVGGKVRLEAPNRSKLGAVIGAVAGGVAGIIGGPIGMAVLAGVGAIAGAWFGRDAGRPVSGSELMALGRELPPGSSALLLLVGTDDVKSTIEALRPFEAHVVNLTAVSDMDDIVIGEPVSFPTAATQGEENNS